MMVKHLLSMQDLNTEEILDILVRATEIKQSLRNREPHKFLRGKTLAMIFAKPSTRTRVSFETAITHLGGHAIYMGWSDLQLGRGETIADTARTLSRYVDVITARLFKHDDIVELARHSSVPVINALTDLHHPCQTLADLLTIQERKKGLRGLKLAWIGDGNNVCNSLMLGCTLVGMNISVGCPKGYEPPDEIVKQAKKNVNKVGGVMEISNDPKKTIKGADIIYTDVWVSMGQDKERKKRLRDFKRYQVNPKLLKHAKCDVIFMHCLPAHRGEEVTAEVMDGPRSAVWDQAENRMHAQKALLVSLIRSR